jgi:hypothetical protein
LVETLVVDAASRGTALGLLLLVAEGALGLLVYAVSLHLLAPDFARELRTLLRTARRPSGLASAVQDEASVVDSPTGIDP